jgi:hypothetical protein
MSHEGEVKPARLYVPPELNVKAISKNTSPDFSHYRCIEAANQLN